MSDACALIYRLKRWPELPAAVRTVDVLRALSLMSTRRITRRWLLARSQLDARNVDRLLAHLVAIDAVEVTDPSRFARDVH
jgi:hypothetical protein